MNDFISKMTADEILTACCKIVDFRHDDGVRIYSLHGMIIEKLQEWRVQFGFDPKDGSWSIYPERMRAGMVNDLSLQRAFLQAAKDLGHWTPPQKVKEEPLTLEERIDALETKMRVLLPSYSK